MKQKKQSRQSLIDQVNMDAIEDFSRQVYYRDPYTSMHAEHVADLMAGLASQMGMTSDEINLAYMVGIVHDVGKIKTPTAVLQKPDRLNEEEFAVVKAHAAEGAEMLAAIDGAESIIPIMRHHHERWDGQGYPDGLAGDRIPLLSQMLAVCDAFDAMTTQRCYRTPVSLGEALREIRRCADSQFAPAVATAFIEFIRERFGYYADG